LPRAEAALRGWADDDGRQAMVLGDLHLENGLFDAGRLIGVVDFGAVRSDVPAADVARLVGSVEFALQPEVFAGRGEAIWSRILAAYRREWSFSEREEELARCLMCWTPVITLGNWLCWLVIDRRRFDVPREILETRLQGWVRVVASRL
jgi:Ser/Thr protein kinase RdoA (MazF antagonist)